MNLDGELLEKSGAMTGGSFQQRGNQLSFGAASDADEAEPLRRRLLELGETLLACKRKEAELGRALEELRPQLSRLEQRKAALEAERTAAQRAHGPLQERRDQLTARIKQIETDLSGGQQRLQAIATELSPLQQALQELEASEASAQASGDSERWQGLQQELEAADAALTQAMHRQVVEPLEPQALQDPAQLGLQFARPSTSGCCSPGVQAIRFPLANTAGDPS